MRGNSRLRDAVNRDVQYEHVSAGARSDSLSRELLFILLSECSVRLCPRSDYINFVIQSAVIQCPLRIRVHKLGKTFPA